MSGDDLRILSDRGESVVVTVTQLTVGPDEAPDDIADRVVDAVEGEFADDDGIVIER